MTMEASTQPAPRRRTREQVQTAVREAMLELISNKSFKDVTVDELARAAGLSRTAFYFYYPDKNAVLRSVSEEVAAELYREADRWWHGEGPPEQVVRTALEGIGSVYARHAGILRAALEATTYDPDFDSFYRGVVQRFIDATAEHLRDERAAGRLRSIDPKSSAEALVWMVERCNFVFVVLEGRPAAELASSLTELWITALYPDTAPTP